MTSKIHVTPQTFSEFSTKKCSETVMLCSALQQHDEPDLCWLTCRVVCLLPLTDYSYIMFWLLRKLMAGKVFCVTVKIHVEQKLAWHGAHLAVTAGSQWCRRVTEGTQAGCSHWQMAQVKRVMLNDALSLAPTAQLCHARGLLLSDN